MVPTIVGFSEAFPDSATVGGYSWNYKRLRRNNSLLKLNFRRKGKQWRPVRNSSPLATPEALNQIWNGDFMLDVLACGHRFRTFNVVNDFNQEGGR